VIAVIGPLKYGMAPAHTGIIDVEITVVGAPHQEGRFPDGVYRLAAVFL
jgi:hypothetical protein